MSTQPVVKPRASCEGRYVDSLSDCPQPGDFRYASYISNPEHSKDYLMYCCPCGCGAVGTLQLRPARENNRPSWAWDGNVEKPTLTPSINNLQLDDRGNVIGEHWHGWLKAGRFEHV